MAKHILFVGGGTAGHISPLLAVMEAVQQQDPSATCSYVGLKSDVASPLITESTLTFQSYSIPAGKLNRYLTIKQVSQTALVAAGMVRAYALLRKLKPDIIFSKGGYVSVPVVMAARRLGIPVVSHETDSIPGLANRIVARSAQKICTAFPVEAYSLLPKEKLYYTGQPVRTMFREKAPVLQSLLGRSIEKNMPIITVIGGSQGARKVNQLMEAVWPRLLERAQLVHIIGSLDFEVFREAAQKLPEQLQQRLWVVPFIKDELPALFQQSTLVISRAGGTIAELAATASPTLLVPLSTSAQGHQQANAQYLQRIGAVEVIDETAASAEDIWLRIQTLLENPDRRAALSTVLGGLDRPHAAATIAEALLKN